MESILLSCNVMFPVFSALLFWGMLELREELLAIEEDRRAGRNGCTLDELDQYLDDVY